MQPPPPSLQDNESGIPGQESSVDRENWVRKIGRNYLLPKARIGRVQFIVRTGLIWLAFGLVTTLWFAIPISKMTNVSALSVIGYLLIFLLFFWAMSMQAAKRLHDFNRSAGWVFAGVIMLAWAGRLTNNINVGRHDDPSSAIGAIGILGTFVFGLILSLARGTKGSNRFGPPPITSKGTKIAGVVCACLLALLLIRIASVGVSRSQPKIEQSSTADKAAHRAVKGKKLPYSLELPTDWSVEYFDKGPVDMRVSLISKGMIVEVLAAPGDLGSPEQAFGSISKWKEDPTSPSDAFIAGKRWLRFLRYTHASAAGSSPSLRLRTVEYLYSGPEGTYALSGSTPPNVFEQNLPQMEAIIQSFKFPFDALKSQTSDTRSEATVSPIPTIFASPSSHLPNKMVKGSAVEYSLEIPPEWKVKQQQQLSAEESDFDLIASHKTLSIGVIAEEANLGDVDTVVSFSRKRLKDRGSNIGLSDVETTSIDGRTWRTFNAHVTTEKIPFAYQFYVYTGPEGTFQLLGWTFENLFERDAPQLRQVLRSFKFSPHTKNTGEQLESAQETRSPSETSDDEREIDLPTLARNARPAVLLIVGFDADGKIAKSGSGFFISRGGRIVTNWHVVDGAMTAAAKSETGAIYKIAGVLAYSPRLDLAVLKAEVEDVPFLAIQQQGTPDAGSRIAVIGSPHALEGSLSEGIVSAVRKTEDGTWIQMTAPVSPGSSGSPVLNTRGRVVGVATLNSTGRYQNLNFARSSQDLSGLLDTIPRNAAVRPFAKLATWGPQPATAASPSESPTRRTGIVAASDKNGLHVRADHTAKSAIVATLHHGDQVFLENGYFRNVEPPEPVDWQQVTTLDGQTGWIRAGYISASESSQ